MDALIHGVQARFVARLKNQLDMKKTTVSSALKKLFGYRIVKKIQIA
jgi:DNA-binding transcriptional regulator GbsR (MarR family)